MLSLVIHNTNHLESLDRFYLIESTPDFFYVWVMNIKLLRFMRSDLVPPIINKIVPCPP